MLKCFYILDHCMVQFVKKNLLGAKDEFKNMFIDPIDNGNFSDSNAQDVQLMKERFWVLTSLTKGWVQWKNYSEIADLLPKKQEYVIMLHATPLQKVMYQDYLARTEKRNKEEYIFFVANFYNTHNLFIFNKYISITIETSKQEKI